MRIGIFGGSFDPVHYGHLLLAEYCCEQAELDQFWFIPADIPPHKLDGLPSTGHQRAEMLELAMRDHPLFQVCGIELDRGGVSYTVDTLHEIHKRQDDAELFLPMGADSLADLPNWRQPDKICRLATPLAVQRPGFDQLDFTVLQDLMSPARIAEMRNMQIQMPLIELSSTAIRRRVAQDKSIRYHTADAVVDFIQQQGLYRV